MPAWGQFRFRKGLSTYALDAVLEVADAEAFGSGPEDGLGDLDSCATGAGL